MTLWHIVAVGAGGFFGAISRYYIAATIGRRFPRSLPYGTLTVNLIGSFLLGWIAGRSLNPFVFLLFGTGFLGAFTTFSTFKLESIRLIGDKSWGKLFIYIGTSYILGILLAYFGFTAT